MKTPSPRATESLSETLYVDKLIAGGLGFGRRGNGEPVFVRGAVPGDKLELETLEKHKGYSRAQHFRLLQPSAQRRTPPCEHQQHCGGCDLMTLEHSAQLDAKRAMVLDILQRTGKLDATEGSAVPLVWRAPEDVMALGYRTRIRLHLSPLGQFGFLAEQSHTVVEVSRCLVANPQLNKVLAQLSHCAALHPGLFAAFGQVEIRVLGEHPDLMWFPNAPSHPSTTRRPNHAKRGARITPTATKTHARQRPLGALETLRRSLENLAPSSAQWLMSVASETDAWRANCQTVDLHTNHGGPPTQLLFAPGMFTQVNWQINQTIIADVLQRVHTLKPRNFLDLYCGAGNFSLPLLRAGLEGIGIEANPLSIAAATAASSHQNLGGRFVASDVTTKLAELAQGSESFDLVLLDPPRAGFKDAAPHLARLAHKAVFVCSCDPTTFARDLRALLELGFVLDALVAYDMFPQTHHLELTAWLHRDHTSQSAQQRG